jgi:hypothetical protein
MAGHKSPLSTLLPVANNIKLTERVATKIVRNSVEHKTSHDVFSGIELLSRLTTYRAPLPRITIHSLIVGEPIVSPIEQINTGKSLRGRARYRPNFTESRAILN